jgi:hypothetical protein
LRERERELNRILLALRKLARNDENVNKYVEVFERMLEKVEYIEL